MDSCKTAFLNCVLSAFGQQEALNGDGGPEEERSQGISTPCSLLHVASPTEVAPFHQLWCLLHRPTWYHLLPGDAVSWAPERKDCPHPWLFSLRHGSSFLLVLVSGGLKVLLFAFPALPLPVQPIPYIIPFPWKCLVISVFLTGHWFNQENKHLHHGNLLNSEQHFHGIQYKHCLLSQPKVWGLEERRCVFGRSGECKKI